MSFSRRDFLRLALLAPAFRISLQDRSSGASIRFLNYDDVEPILRSGKLSLPEALARVTNDGARSAWPRWVRARDVQIRSRLQRGEEDTLANFVLFGISFTNVPRVTTEIGDPGEIDRRIRLRVEAFVSALAAPAGNERLVFLADLIRRLGYTTVRGEPRERLAEYVMENIHRYLGERQRYQNTVDLLAGNDTNPALAGAADLYRDRGLSVDTDFRPNYAIDAALLEAKRRGLVSTIRRVAVIGPGLDFTDKDSGFDYYPLQTLQPFAVVDSLVRLGLSEVRNLRVSLLDISKPTLDHISKAMTKARAQQGYTLQLMLDRARPWTPGAVEYWQRLGSAIGTAVDPLPLPIQAQNMTPRAVRIRAEVNRVMEPVQANIILQRMNLPLNQRFDLIIATNLLVYYEAFEQALALSNVEAMLAPGGVFLTNDLTQEYPGVRLRPVAITRVSYSGNQEDQVQIYSRSAFQPQFPPV